MSEEEKRIRESAEFIEIEEYRRKHPFWTFIKHVLWNMEVAVILVVEPFVCGAIGALVFWLIEQRLSGG